MSLELSEEKRSYIKQRTARRRKRDQRFKYYGIAAIGFAAAFLVFFFAYNIHLGYKTFMQAEVLVTITYNDESAEVPTMAVANEFRRVVSRSVLRTIPYEMELDPFLNGNFVTKWVLADAEVDQFMKGKPNRLKGKFLRTVEKLDEEGKIKLKLNTGFFTFGDSKMPESAGLQASIVGTIFVMVLTMLLCIPIGVMTAIYLEEYAPENSFTRLIEVNINNLAAIPSIIYGLLGLAIFINFLGFPRSSVLVGGFTLSLRTLPVIIISTRATIRAVPDSIRQGAYGVGASDLQVVWHHVLPLSIPGILTGSILGLSQAIGETAPLIIIGMMAFIPQAPSSFLDAASVLPAQIYTWSTNSLRAFEERTAAAILVLLVIMLCLNGIAIWFRNKYEIKW